MVFENKMRSLDDWKKLYPEKFTDEEVVFSHIRRGDHIFVASGCGEPQYLVRAMVGYVESHPRHSSTQRSSMSTPSA
jgi:acyl-CoA hydrolase